MDPIGSSSSGALVLSQRFIQPSLERQRQTELIVSVRVIRIEFDRSSKLALGARPVKFVKNLNTASEV